MKAFKALQFQCFGGFFFCLQSGGGQIDDRCRAERGRAHTANDKAVMAAYGFSTKMTEADCVAELMKLYQQKVEQLGEK